MSKQVTEQQCAPDCKERTECATVGTPGHFQCGTCSEHDRPRHHCGCVVIGDGQKQ